MKSQKKNRIPLRVTDTTLRDAHQSLWATRMRTEDILGIIDTVDSVGYYSLEVWGGATFDVCLRFLRENPWERLRQIKARAKKTPLQMLLRGQNILGYKNYPDDLLDRFVMLACQNGVDIFRIFDALNDNRNMEFAINAVKQHGGHAQGTICYTISPVHTVEKYVQIAKEQVALGVDSLCIKDMAGILSPISAEKLVAALVQAIDVPVQLHCHATSGMATATYVEAVRAGAGAIDCAISPMAGFNSQPPVETMLAIFDETVYHTNLDVDALRKICKYFLALAPRRKPKHHPENTIDPEILIHHIPGGMISNLQSQLEQQGALDRLGEVLAELPEVCADMGYPPLVTPTSQVVGVQAVLNVLSGERYSMVTEETKNYVKGLYGRSPAPIDTAIKRKILGKEKVMTCRPADLLEPMLPQAARDISPDLVRNEEDIISYCLFPEPALEYFKWRNLLSEDRPATPADLERQQDKDDKKQKEEPAKAFLAQSDYASLDALMGRMKEYGIIDFTVGRNDLHLNMKFSADASLQDLVDHTSLMKDAEEAPDEQKQISIREKPEKEGQIGPSADGLTIDAPLNGTFYTSSGPGKPSLVNEGDEVKAGDPVCIVEAMKLFNQIKAPTNCRINKFLVRHGASVRKGQPLVSIRHPMGGK